MVDLKCDMNKLKHDLDIPNYAVKKDAICRCAWSRQSKILTDRSAGIQIAIKKIRCNPRSSVILFELSFLQKGDVYSYVHIIYIIKICV